MGQCSGVVWGTVHQSSECVRRPDWSHWKRNWNSVSGHYHLAKGQRYEFWIKHLHFSFALCRFPDLDFHIRQMKNSRICITVSSYKAHKWDNMFNMQCKGDSCWDSCKKGSKCMKLRFYRDALQKPRLQASDSILASMPKFYLKTLCLSWICFILNSESNWNHFC